MTELLNEPDEVGAVIFDNAITLRTVGGVEVRMETEVEVRAGEKTIRVDPEAAGLGARFFVEALRQTVTGIQVTAAGELILSLDQLELRVLPHDEFEAWSVSGTEGPIAVCGVGGGVTTWSVAR